LILVDSSAMFAALVGTERHHARTREALEREQPPFVLSPFVLCELDYLLATRANVATELAFLDDVVAGAYELVSFESEDIGDARAVIAKYGDLEIGLADASVVVLSGRFATERVLTLDERHFRALRTPAGRPFTLLPTDA
jgi:uncharacterized protein